MLINYLFCIGDRHFDNILLTPNGILLNIDYGFIMGAEPKTMTFGDSKYRIAPEIKWNNHLADPIFTESNKTVQNENYQKLMQTCFEGFEIIRKY